jgi:hypothetical protein
MWGRGYGNTGFGQSNVSAPISTVSSTALTTAAQWASLIGALNNIIQHTNNSGSAITLPTTGTQINALSTISTSIDTAWLSREPVNSTVNGPSVVYTLPRKDIFSGNYGARTYFYLSQSITFADDDRARYFFNANGSISITYTATAAGTGTTRSIDIARIVSNISVRRFGSHTSSGNTVSGTSWSSSTNGYYTVSNGATATQLVSGSSPTPVYASQQANIQSSTGSSLGRRLGNGSNGDILYFFLNVDAAAKSLAAPTIQNNLAISITPTITINFPSSTYLGNTWGAPTVAQFGTGSLIVV